MSEYITPVDIFISAENGERRDSLYYNHCTFRLPRPLYIPDGFSAYVSLIEFTVPMCFPSVSNRFNTLVINDIDYTVRAGWYDQQQLIRTLKPMLPPNTSLSYSTITRRCTLSNATEQLTVDGSMCSLLGFAKGSSGNTIEGVHSLDLSGINGLWILSNDLIAASGNIDCRAISTGNVLCRVPIAAPIDGIISYTDYGGRSGLLVSNDVITAITIEIEDEDRHPAQIELPYDLTLQVRFIPSERQRMVRAAV